MPLSHSGNDASLSTSQIEDVRAKITPLLKTQLKRPKTLQDFKKIRDRSAAECDRLLEWIDACLNDVPRESRELSDVLEDTQLELREVEQALQKVPSEEALRPLIEKLSALNQDLGQTTQTNKRYRPIYPFLVLST